MHIRKIRWLHRTLRHSVPVIGSVLLYLVLTTTAWAESPGWKAGWARDVITPQHSMWMAGYGSRTSPSEGKLTDLWVKALVLEDQQGQRAVLVTLDLVGIGRELAQGICAELEEKCQLQRAQIALCTSHTHTGPVVGRNLSAMHYRLLDATQQKLIDDYTQRLHEQVVAVVVRAAENLSPCQLSYGSGFTTFAVNRRNNPEAQVPQLRTLGQLVGPVDHDVPVLAVRDAEGHLKTVVFGYACHSTVLSFNLWSGDYPGFAQIALEEALPDCQAMFWAGCGADQNPLPRRTPELAQQYGRQLADAVQQVLAAPMTALPPALSTHYQEIDLAFGTLPDQSQIEQDAKSSDKFIAARAALLLETLDRDGQLALAYPYPIGQWTLGTPEEGIDWVLLGGEVVVDYALRLKLERHGKRTWVAGYTNDVMAYIPSRRVLLEGGYEGGGAMVYYGLPAPWSEECERAIVDAVR